MPQFMVFSLPTWLLSLVIFQTPLVAAHALLHHARDITHEKLSPLAHPTETTRRHSDSDRIPISTHSHFITLLPPTTTAQVSSNPTTFSTPQPVRIITASLSTSPAILTSSTPPPPQSIPLLLPRSHWLFPVGLTLILLLTIPGALLLIWHLITFIIRRERARYDRWRRYTAEHRKLDLEVGESASFRWRRDKARRTQSDPLRRAIWRVTEEVPGEKGWWIKGKKERRRMWWRSDTGEIMQDMEGDGGLEMGEVRRKWEKTYHTFG